MHTTSGRTSPTFQRDLYISYSHKDEAQVMDLEMLLKEIGINAWLDRHEVINQKLTDAFAEGIRSSRYFCCILSQHTQSAWIEYEVSTFFNDRRPEPGQEPSLILLSLSKDPEMPPTLKTQGGSDYRMIDLEESLLNGFCELSRIFIGGEAGVLRFYRYRNEVLPHFWDMLYRNANNVIDLMGRSLAPAFRDERDKKLVLPAVRDRGVAMRVLLLNPRKPDLQQTKEVQEGMHRGAVITLKVKETIGYIEALQLDLAEHGGRGSLDYRTTNNILYSTVSVFDKLAIATPYSNQAESGDHSPTFLLGPTNDYRELRSFYCDEFKRYWDPPLRTQGELAHHARKADLVRPYIYTGTFWQDHDSKFPDALEGKCPPAQLEIHPPSAPGAKQCWLQCPHCYGDGEQTPTDAEKLDEMTAVRVVKEVKSQVPRIVISGTYSDPLFSDITPALLRAAREAPVQTIGLHTKLLKLDADLENAVLDGCQVGDYLAISLDAGTPQTYDQVHGRSRRGRAQRPSDMLGTVRANLLRICGRIHDMHLPLRINLTYLLTDRSAQESDVEKAIGLAIEAGVDFIRFSVPQPQTLASANRTMVSREAVEGVRKVIEEQKIAQEGRKPMILLTDFSQWSLSGFRRCYSQLFHPAVGGDGYLYPCCQVASKDFAHLRIGDLREQRFWALWHGNQRRQLLEMDTGERGCNEPRKMNCRVCNRKDGAINATLGRRYERASK